MIARTWRGATRAADAERYLAYLQRTGLAAYGATPGNAGVLALRRVTEDRAEFLLISLWDSWDAIRAFAGDHPDHAVFYPEDDQFLVARDEHVDHFEVVFTAAVPTPQAPSRHPPTRPPTDAPTHRRAYPPTSPPAHPPENGGD